MDIALEQFFDNESEDLKDLSEEESSHSEQCFMEGIYSEEVPSELWGKRKDKFFPNHF